VKGGLAWPVALLLSIVAALAAGMQAPEITQPIVFERAEFVESESHRIPPDDAPWRPVRLPDNWHQSRPGYSGIGWYRIELPPIAATRRVHLVHVSRDSADLIRFFLNRHIVGSSQRPDPSLRLYQQPYATGMLGGSLREGKNTMHILVEGRSDLRHGLPRVWFGDSVPIRAMWLERYRRHVLLPMGCAFAVLAVGIIALAFWWRNRRDPQFLWTGLAATLIGAPTLLHFFIGPGASGAGRDVLQLFYAYGAAPALAMSGLHMARIERRGMAWLLWGVLGAAGLSPLFIGQHEFVLVSSALSVIFLLILVAVFTLVLLRSGHLGGWVRGTMVAALAAVIAFAAHDLSIWMGWIDFDRIALSAFSAPVLTLALGTLVISRHLEAVQGLAQANINLEHRVADRTAEIERTYQQVRMLESEQARAAERQRIMSDIHDGLGASLVGLLSVVQAGRAEPEKIEQRVHDALVELRLAVDSLDTLESDLLTALATVRYRMRDVLEAAGIELEWRVGDIPDIGHFTPRAILDIQHIALEALTNAIRHAGARRITVSTRVGGGFVELEIADDGRGFDPVAPRQGGRGLMTMQRRAAAVGSRLALDSSPGCGTRLTLRFDRPPQA